MDGNDELLAMAGGDRGVAEGIRTALERLRDGAGSKEMRDLARDVLDGRTSLRQAGMSDAYAAALRGSLDRLNEWRDEIGEEEYQQQLEQARQRLRSL
jgi:hypothetical protein